MKLKDILSKAAVIGDLKSSDKQSLLEELADKAIKSYPELSTKDILEVLLERERLGSTCVGNGVAIPHGKIQGLKSIMAVFGRSKKGIDFHSHDHKNTNLFFVLLAPENVVGNHLQALARLSRLLKSEIVRSRLLETKDENLYELLIQEDEKL